MAQRIERLLRDEIGLDVDSVGPAALDGAVRQRIAACGAGGIDAYWRLLETSPAERQALIDAVVVPETWFFRYPDAFGLLQRLALARLREAGRSGPMRLLSLPCATGEEPYSIAIALLDAGLPEAAFEVAGIDVSAQAVAAARTGRYGDHAFREPGAGIRARRFTEEADGARIAPALRRKVRFRRGNLLDPMLPQEEPRVDFLFCRNLLIYFHGEARKRGIAALVRLLLPDGVLFAGAAEAALLSRSGLEPVGGSSCFAFRRAAPAAPERRRTLPSARPAVTAFAPRPAAPPPAGPHRPVPSVAAERGNDADGLAADLQQVRALADRGRAEEAHALCEQSLARHGPVAELYYWLGLLHDAKLEEAEAERCYRKAIYLDPEHEAARAQMATLRSARRGGSGG